MEYLESKANLYKGKLMKDAAQYKDRLYKGITSSQQQVGLCKDILMNDAAKYKVKMARRWKTWRMDQVMPLMMLLLLNFVGAAHAATQAPTFVTDPTNPACGQAVTLKCTPVQGASGSQSPDHIRFTQSGHGQQPEAWQAVVTIGTAVEKVINPLTNFHDGTWGCDATQGAEGARETNKEKAISTPAVMPTCNAGKPTISAAPTPTCGETTKLKCKRVDEGTQFMKFFINGTTNVPGTPSYTAPSIGKDFIETDIAVTTTTAGAYTCKAAFTNAATKESDASNTVTVPPCTVPPTKPSSSTILAQDHQDKLINNYQDKVDSTGGTTTQAPTKSAAAVVISTKLTPMLCLCPVMLAVTVL